MADVERGKLMFPRYQRVLLLLLLLEEVGNARLGESD